MARPLELLEVPPVLLAQRVPHPLPAGCLGKVAAAVAAELGARAVLAVLEVVALVAAVAVLHAVRTLLALVVSVVLAGHWYWSFDYAAICRC